MELAALTLPECSQTSPDGDDRRTRDYEAERRLFAGLLAKASIFSHRRPVPGILQFGYGSMCMLPVLADSVVVIDEVHSFDRNMLAALKDFLTNSTYRCFV